MARRVVTQKWTAPKKSDHKDKRCVFVTKHDSVEHTKLHWCMGCGFYVCVKCNKRLSWLGPTHEVELHIGAEDVDVN